MATGLPALLRFPNPVNELVARTVACTVLVLSIAAAATANRWVIAVLAAGFVLRVTTANRIDPIAFVASRVIAPRLGTPRWTPGPPKRFAQGIGAALTVPATVLASLAPRRRRSCSSRSWRAPRPSRAWRGSASAAGRSRA
jgi:hypothetical protein